MYPQNKNVEILIRFYSTLRLYILNLLTENQAQQYVSQLWKDSKAKLIKMFVFTKTKDISVYLFFF